MTDSLNLIRLELDRRELFRAAARHHLPKDADEGYLIHAGLCQVFAESEEKTVLPFGSFVVDPGATLGGAELRILAYSKLDETELVERIGEGHQRLLRNVASRPMPMLTTGTRARFRVRACPVVRTRQPGLHDTQVTARKSREMDAWLAERIRVWKQEPPKDETHAFERSGQEWLDRERVYGAWLLRQLERDGAACLEGTSMESFQRLVMYRRGRGKQHRMTRPDVVLEGTLKVTDAAGFQNLLRRGVGRHRAFGFGTLLLRGA